MHYSSFQEFLKALAQLEEDQMQEDLTYAKEAPPPFSNQPKEKPMGKYQRKVKGAVIDVYDVLEAFNVTCPARQHAIKKLLATGQRGHKDVETDLIEALSSVKRSLELATGKSIF